MKKIELTQKELDKLLGKQRKAGYDMGIIHARAERLPYQEDTAVKGIILLDALTEFLDGRYDKRYEWKKEDY